MRTKLASNLLAKADLQNIAVVSGLTFVSSLNESAI